MANYNPPWNKGKKQSEESLKEKRKVRYQKNRVVALAYAKKRYHEKKGPISEEKKDYLKWWHIKDRYGLTKDLFLEMFAAQGGLCALHCGRAAIAVDHCHKTGKIRKLLCKPCNTALGFIKENFDVALSLAKYIQEHNGIT